jgi:hypothetical protein
MGSLRSSRDATALSYREQGRSSLVAVDGRSAYDAKEARCERRRVPGRSLSMARPSSEAVRGADEKTGGGFGCVAPVGAAHRAPLRAAPGLFLCIAALLGACVDNPLDTTPPVIVAASIENAPVSLVRNLVLTLDRPALVQALYWTEGARPLLVESESASLEHELVLGRLHADRLYSVEARVLDGSDGASVPWRAQFRTPPLPEGLARISFHAEGKPTNPLTMVEVAQSDAFTGFVIVDETGRVVWFYPTRGGANGSTRRRDGSLVLLEESQGLLHVTGSGRRLASLPQDSASRRIHHDVVETATGTLLFLALDWRPARDTVVAGEAIWEWNPDTGAVTKRWTAWDHLDPMVDWGPLSNSRDWLHANSLAIGVRGNLIMSLHFLNQVISIAPGFGALEWRLGGVGSTFPLAEAERFSGQHTAAEIAPNRVIVFDNGFERVLERYSRAVEFDLDLNGRRAQKVWEWRPSPAIWSRIVSLARRLEGGNAFVAFGSSSAVAGSTGPVSAYEVAPDGSVVWRLGVDGVRLMYRAWPLSDVAGEKTIR